MAKYPSQKSGQVELQVAIHFFANFNSGFAIRNLIYVPFGKKLKISIRTIQARRRWIVQFGV